MLPAPLSVGVPPRRVGRESSPAPSVGRSQNHLVDDEFYAESGSHHRLIPSPGDYAASPDEFEPPRLSGSGEQDRYRASTPPVQSAAAAAMIGGGVRHGTVASGYPAQTANPYQSSLPQVAQTTALYSDHGHSGDTDDEFPRRPDAVPASTTAPSSSSRAARGVSLVDHGPVPSGNEARRVPRPSARKQSGSGNASGSGNGGAKAPAQSQSSTPMVHQQEDRARSSSRHQPLPPPPPGAANPPPPPAKRWNDPRYQ